MKKIIRKNVFETNSSSVHTLVFSDDLEPSHLPVNKDNYTVTHFGSFGKSFENYFSQEDKLSYIVSYLYYYCGYSVENIYDNYCFDVLNDVIKNYCGTNGLVISDSPSEPDIDHQSQPNSSNHILNSDNLYDRQFLKTFIFNPLVGIHTDCD